MNKPVKCRLFNVMILLVLTVFCGITVAQGQKQNSSSKHYSIGYIKNIFYDVDLNDVQAALKVWVDELVRNYKGHVLYKIDSRLYENLKDANESVQRDEIAAVSLSSYDYLKYGSKMNLEPVLVPEIEKQIGLEYLFIVRKKDGIKSLKELRGKKVAVISTPIYIAASLWLDVLLAREKLPPKEKYFNEIATTQKESQIILSLFFDNVDACVVSKSSFNLMNELNPQVGEKLQIIAVSPAFMTGLLCYTRLNRDELQRKELSDNLTGLHRLTAGKQILSLLKIGRLIPFKDEYLNSFRNLLKEHNKLVQR